MCSNMICIYYGGSMCLVIEALCNTDPLGQLKIICWRNHCSRISTFELAKFLIKFFFIYLNINKYLMCKMKGLKIWWNCVELVVTSCDSQLNPNTWMYVCMYVHIYLYVSFALNILYNANTDRILCELTDQLMQ